MPATAADTSAPAHPAGLSALIPGFQPPADGRVRGVVVAGVDDPGLVRSLLEALPPMADGYEPPLFVVEPRNECAAAVARSERVHVYTGPSAPVDFLRDRLERITLSLPRHVVRGSASAGAWVNQIHAGLAELTKQQQTLDGSLRHRLEDRARTRGADHWTARFAAIRAGSTPARVMVLTSRYSTFVRHAAEDLAEALREIGHESTVLIEPEAGATLTSCHYLEAIEQFDPDMIVGINYLRSSLGRALPGDVPYVCWIQDAMAQLLGSTGRAGPLDFIAGHCYPGMLERLGCERGRVLEHFVPVSERKFSPREPSDAERRRFSCDIAYLSHRSETPEAFHERFARGQGMRGHAKDALDRCRDRVAGAVSRWATQPSGGELPAASETLAAELGLSGDPRMRDLLRHQYVLPLAEQMLRHETLAWAAEIAREHGLSMRLFGRGWERHPTLSMFAAGPLEHGDEVRTCYQLAACHVHASPLGVAHQRVFECAMSGGLALCRRSWEELYHHDYMIATEFLHAGLPHDAVREDTGWGRYVIANNPILMLMIRDRQRMIRKPQGWDHEGAQGQYGHPAHVMAEHYDWAVPPRRMRALDILGDILETTFSTRDELCERILLATARGTWREQVSAGIAGRARAAVGMRPFARRLIGLVAGALAPESNEGADACV